MRRSNPKLRVHHTNTFFVAYGTRTEIPISGKMNVHLRNRAGHKEKTMVYMMEDQEESLLGKEDAKAMGILTLNLERKDPT